MRLHKFNGKWDLSYKINDLFLTIYENEKYTCIIHRGTWKSWEELK